MSDGRSIRILADPVSAIPIALLLVATLGSGWLLLDSTPDGAEPDAPVSNSPDLVIDGFVATILDETGQPHRRVRATNMMHFPDTDTHELTDPYMEVFSPGAEPWFVRSDTGWLSADGDEMLLKGDVHIWRNASDGSRRLDVKTSDLRVFPETEYGETDQPVSITTPHGRSTSVGMRAFLKQGRMEMLSQVRTVYKRNAFTQ